MEKKIEFDSDISEYEAEGSCHADMPSIFNIQIPREEVWKIKKQFPGGDGFHVTLSPACPVTIKEPDYKAMWENLRASLRQWKHDPDDHCIPNVLGEMADIEAMAYIESLHTPQGDQKKEQT